MKSYNTDKDLQVICKMELVIETVLVMLQRVINIVVIVCFQRTNSSF